MTKRRRKEEIRLPKTEEAKKKEVKVKVE